MTKIIQQSSRGRYRQTVRISPKFGGISELFRYERVYDIPPQSLNKKFKSMYYIKENYDGQYKG